MIPSLRLTSALVACALLPVVSSAVTTLSGDSAANNTNIAPNYGSNLIGTPNIALTWSTSADVWQAYSAWTNLSPINTTGTGVYQVGDGTLGTNYSILFTPDAGYAVKLSQLDINVYDGGGTFAMQARIMDSTASTTFTTFTQSFVAGNTTWDFSNYTGTVGQPLLLQLSVTSTSKSGAGYLAMDNLVFDQVSAVPEPSTYGLMGAAALAAAALVRRRRKSAGC